jgi:type IV secretory pathway VirJ component
MIALVLLLALSATGPGPLEVPGFGPVELHPPPSAPRRVVVFLSGVAGLDDAARAFADALASRGDLVVAVDTKAYARARPEGRCAYPAGDLETLAQAVEKRVGLGAYVRPVLVGHSRGAALLWAALAQGPVGTFAGGVALAPCPERSLGPRLCSGAGPAPEAGADGDRPARSARPGAPLTVIAGVDDATCPLAGAERFGRAVSSPVVALAGVGHPLDPPGPWVDAVEAALARLEPRASSPAATSAPEVRDLPVVEGPPARPGKRLAVLITGDGGWVGLDQGVAAALAGAGVAVVGLDSLRYFWKRRSPEETARDVGRIVAHYRAAWRRDEVFLVGYSRGADIVPFLLPRLPERERAAVRLVAMLGPSTFAEFEVHVVDLFSAVRRSAALSTEAAVRALAGAPVMCVQGEAEEDSLCPRVDGLPGVKRVVLPGGHHFAGDYARLARLIVDAAPP